MLYFTAKAVSVTAFSDLSTITKMMSLPDNSTQYLSPESQAIGLFPKQK